MLSSPLVLKTIAALLSVAAGIALGYLVSPGVGILVLCCCLWWFYKPVVVLQTCNLSNIWKPLPYQPSRKVF